MNKTNKQPKDKRKMLVRILCVILCLVMLIPLIANALVIMASVVAFFLQWGLYNFLAAQQAKAQDPTKKSAKNWTH